MHNTAYQSTSLMILVDTKSIISGKAKLFKFSQAIATGAGGVVPGPLGTGIPIAPPVFLSDEEMQEPIGTTTLVDQGAIPTTGPVGGGGVSGY